MDRAMLEALCKSQDNKEQVVLITVVNTLGSTPRKAGSKMLVWADGRMLGSIGGGCAEAGVKMKALTALDDGQSSLHRVEMLNDIASMEGMVCGGVMELFIQVI